MQHRPSFPPGSRRTTTAKVVVGMVIAGVGVLLFPAPPEDEDGEWGRSAEAGTCPKGMVSILDKFCIDQFEGSTVEVDKPRTRSHKPKTLKKHSPYKPVKGLTVMAVSEKGKVPQAHITQEEAAQACFNAGKRLCTDEEWLTACRGKKPTKFPYGDTREDGRCNDKGVSGFNLLFGPGNNTPPQASAYTMTNMNDPRLNQIEGTVAKSGAFSKCKNGFKVFDMVGNLHEWTSAKEGTFRGGYYLDTSINGEGCDYRTTAHDVKYHDYSTGFRCCSGGAEQARIEREARASKKSDTKDAKQDSGKQAKKSKPGLSKKGSKKSKG